MKAILAPHEDGDASRISITGTDAPLSGGALTSFALLLHELATNAAKYGALSSPHGRLHIAIATTDDHMQVRWVECGSPPLDEKNVREGFGTTLEKAALKGIGGTISREWKPDGLSLSLDIPLAGLAT